MGERDSPIMHNGHHLLNDKARQSVSGSSDVSSTASAKFCKSQVLLMQEMKLAIDTRLFFFKS